MDVEVRGVTNNTAGEVRQWFDAALAIMDDAGLDVADHPALAVKVLELLASKTMVTLQRQPGAIGIPMGGLPPGMLGKS